MKLETGRLFATMKVQQLLIVSPEQLQLRLPQAFRLPLRLFIPACHTAARSLSLIASQH